MIESILAALFDVLHAAYSSLLMVDASDFHVIKRVTSWIISRPEPQSGWSTLFITSLRILSFISDPEVLLLG